MVSQKHIEEILVALSCCFVARSELYHQTVNQYLKGGDHGNLNSQGDQSHGSRCLVPTRYPLGGVDGSQGLLLQEDKALDVDAAEVEAQAA